MFGGDKADEAEKFRQGQSWASFCPRLQGAKERLEKGYYLMFVERPVCSRSYGVSWRGRLWPD